MFDEKAETYSFEMEQEVTNVIIDPDAWILMKANFTKKK